ncbi:MAG: glycogen synthase GlgA [Candidatus Omnitrophota bacterium]|nr:glycogen synthase GlgA [Candidatus Omnitrophota bacterium]
MKIAFCASEVVPFAKTGGLADVAGALPLALEAAGCEVIVIMPGYEVVRRSSSVVRRLKEGISYAVIGKNIKVYFIENDKYFGRDGLYGGKSGDYPDNLERFSYYCRRALELLKEINFRADIIHVNDWQAALIPVYLKSIYSQDTFYKNTRTVLTIHNLGYQGLFPREEFSKTGLDPGLFNIDGLEFYGKINILKGGLEFCDVITTVSPTYALEIQTAELGFGLEGVLRERGSRVFGILNGLDYSVWDPAVDNLIAKDYSIHSLEDKYINKEDLQKSCGLTPDKETMLAGIVTRLAEQKGLDILTPVIGNICKMGLQLVILGTGDLKYHRLLQKAAKKYPGLISLNLKFDNRLAHRIYAGADLFLMPSQYEPCGLGQMISLRFGTIPLVFKTGGLADTVNIDNGFVFDKYSRQDLLAAGKQAAAAFRDKAGWRARMERAMRCDFSWEGAAKAYLKVYEKALSS